MFVLPSIIVFEFQIFSTFSEKTKQKQQPTATKNKTIKNITPVQAWRNRCRGECKKKRFTKTHYFMGRLNIIWYLACHLHSNLHMLVSSDPHSHTYNTQYARYIIDIVNIFCIHRKMWSTVCGAEKNKKTSCDVRVWFGLVEQKSCQKQIVF